MHEHAIQDGIRFIERDLAYGTLYFPKCHICGDEMPSLNYIRGQQHTCYLCKLEIKSQKEDKRFNVKRERFTKAIERIYRKVKSPKQYEKAIEIVAKNLKNKGWFESTEEIMVAIELIKNGYKIAHQRRFDRYKADFVIVEEKIVLEVDGKPFHSEGRRKAETIRDNYIRECLGEEWEVIRIDTELINKNISKLVTAMKKAKERRLLVRSKHNGEIPYSYLKRSY